MRKKLILIALALVMANLMLFNGVVENECKLHHELKCATSLDSEARVCR